MACKLAHNVGCKDCDETIFVPNFFDIKNVRDMLEAEDITEEQFKDFIIENGDRTADKVSEMIKQEIKVWMDDHLQKTLQKVLEETLDWFHEAPTEEIEKVQTVIEWDFPYNNIVKALVPITGKSYKEVVKLSQERNKH